MGANDRTEELVAAQVECLRELTELLNDPLVPEKIKAEVRSVFERKLRPESLNADEPAPDPEVGSPSAESCSSMSRRSKTKPSEQAALDPEIGSPSSVLRCPTIREQQAGSDHQLAALGHGPSARSTSSAEPTLPTGTLKLSKCQGGL